MESEEIKTIVRGILTKNNFGLKMPNDFATNQSLFLQGVIDSFGIFPFVNELQARFNIHIKHREIHPGNFETIENIITFIYKKISDRSEKK